MTDPRLEQIHQLQAADLDVLVIGGGINGAGLIRDLALRSSRVGVPLRIGLVEQHHFASGTSGKNSQLIHGGLRYLKYLQFHLVRESLRERSTLLKIAPQFVKPLAFLLPMYGVNSRIVYGTGLWLYDRLAGSHAIARHKIMSSREVAGLEPGLNLNRLTAGAVFYDCAIPSARFVVENILDAMGHGALAGNYVRAESWDRAANGPWRVQSTDVLTAQRFELKARKLVDARGAWSSPETLRLVRGSHIVLPRMSTRDHAIAHFEPNGRIVFVIPWGSRNQLTLVGTTDEDHTGDVDSVHISSLETDYLLGVVRKLFPHRTDIEPITAFSSLRPLIRGSASSATIASRDHRIWNSPEGVLHIAGGKYTTYRLMSEQAGDIVCREIAPALASVHVTADTPFPVVERGPGELLEQHLSDYLFVSTYLGYEQRWDAVSLRPYAMELARIRGWDEARLRAEVKAIIEASHPVGA